VTPVRATVLVLVLAGTAVTPAEAQTPAPAAAQAASGPGRAREFLAGVTWAGPVPMGSASANLTTPSGSSLTLFGTENSLGSGFGVAAGFGFALGRTTAVEVTGGWSRASLKTEITDDFEDADIEPIRASVNRFTLEGAALWFFKSGAASSWFLRGGAAWVTDLPEGNALAENGVAVSTGVGVRHWWRRDARGRGRTGFRAQGGLEMRSGGVTLGEDTLRFAPAASFVMLFGF
jgi:hypothetical protein